MPRIRIPGIPPQSLWTIGLSAIGAVAIAGFLGARRRRQIPFEETTGGPLVLARTDGVLLRGGFRVIPLGPDRMVRWATIGTHPGAGEDNREFLALSLRADGTVFAVSTMEHLRHGFDMRVSVHDTSSGAVLFSATDNSHPTTVWRGDEPDIPAPLREEQAQLDRFWQEDLQDNPDARRPIAEARFSDPAADGELSFSGWTEAGLCLLSGRSRLTIRSDYSPGREQVTDPFPWWGVAGPTGGGRWDWVERGIGTPPTVHAAVPRPPLARRVALADERLLVDGVAQTDSMLAAGVRDFDGPFA